jgi:class 3 adenylate cyclase
VARWLASQGFERLAVIEGGLAAWRAAGFPVETLRESAPRPTGAGTEPATPTAPMVFLPSLAERYLHDGGLPTRRRLATLFVDIAGSTRLLAHHPPEKVLGVVQNFRIRPAGHPDPPLRQTG